jgi:hypothetical protein
MTLFWVFSLIFLLLNYYLLFLHQNVAKLAENLVEMADDTESLLLHHLIDFERITYSISSSN